MRDRPPQTVRKMYDTTRTSYPGPPSLSGTIDKYSMEYYRMDDDNSIIQQKEQQRSALLKSSSSRFHQPDFGYVVDDYNESVDGSRKSIHPPGMLGRTRHTVRDSTEERRDGPPDTPPSSRFEPCGSSRGHVATATPTPYGYVCSILNHEVNNAVDVSNETTSATTTAMVAIDDDNKNDSNDTRRMIDKVIKQRLGGNTGGINKSSTEGVKLPQQQKKVRLVVNDNSKKSNSKSVKLPKQEKVLFAVNNNSNKSVKLPQQPFESSSSFQTVQPTSDGIKTTTSPTPKKRDSPRTRIDPPLTTQLFQPTTQQRKPDPEPEDRRVTRNVVVYHSTNKGVITENRSTMPSAVFQTNTPSPSREVKTMTKKKSKLEQNILHNTILPTPKGSGSTTQHHSGGPQEEDFPPLTASISYVSQPGFLPPADPSHIGRAKSYSMDEGREPEQESPSIRNNYATTEAAFGPADVGKPATPPLPLKYRRSSFWTPKSRTTTPTTDVPSRSTPPPKKHDPFDEFRGNEEGQAGTPFHTPYGRENVQERRPPQDDTDPLTRWEEHVHLDRIESTRVVSSSVEEIGFPSLSLQPSKEVISSRDKTLQTSHIMQVTSTGVGRVSPSYRPSTLGLITSPSIDEAGDSTNIPVTATSTKSTGSKGELTRPPSSSSSMKSARGRVQVDEHQRQLAQPYQRHSPTPSTLVLDQRTVRMLYADEFSEMIKAHSSEEVGKILMANNNNGVKSKAISTCSGISFRVRKRPLLDSESEQGGFDVVDTPAGHPNAIVLYEASICSDRKTRDLKAHLFRFDGVFSPDVSSEEFYIRCGQGLVMAAVEGVHGTIITFGTTGSGKSHTIADFEQRGAFDIFADAGHSLPSVSVQYVELFGNQIIDLLGPIGSFAQAIQNENDGTFRLEGAIAASVSSADELLLVLSKAKRRFATQSIVRGGNGSQSYLICQILIDHGWGTIGQLSLLECPSEAQSQYSETEVDITEATPFACLMENIRGMVSGNTVKPFETTCNLTKLMQKALTSEQSNLCVVANVSPNATDTEATLATLLSLKKVMNGHPKSTKKKLWNPSHQANNDSSRSDGELTLPRQWSKDQLLSWMSAKKLMPDDVTLRQLNSGGKLSGRLVMRMTKSQLKATFYDTEDDGDRMAQKMFIALRAESDRVARLRVKEKLAREKEQNQHSFSMDGRKKGE